MDRLEVVNKEIDRKEIRLKQVEEEMERLKTELNNLYQEQAELETERDEKEQEYDDDVYCIECGEDEKLTYIANYADTEEWECKQCGNKFQTVKHRH